MLSKTAQRALTGWQTNGSCIVTALLKTKQMKINMNIIQWYAPTNESDENTKDQFYSRLQAVIEILSRRDISIIMGDLNAKVGSDNTGFKEVMAP
jgi:exonuclease III